MQPVLHTSSHQPAERLRVSEIFISLQGESTTIGLPTVFIRLTGCPLRCQYCDTAYAFRGGEIMATSDVVSRVGDYQVKHVTVTGGEPLAQPASLLLLERLCETGYRVSLETSGALDISQVDTRVMKVMDLKTPASGEVDKNRFENLKYLVPRDQVKFVICNREDYLWACQMLEQHAIDRHCEVLFSPAFGQQDAATLAEWIIADRLPVRFQIQLHKILWGDEPGR
ncbi:7-carboxy-7-deazaguanine synthase [Thiogranum longum]|uniref:7-carboxy-7-deazaguanine synthase n=1 Tax=Thiogranum longum TaxID=1537524 RepID=A0A4R1HB16_9GAMM|nr:7-carboxy-7-deazaguanine synthase QueE [Thiogranum longum]TCK17385.1 7-carboxy-7-deazaguanine synthase [Thiogranum longum]